MTASPLPPATGLPAGDDERCPRCGGAFHCGMNDPGPCPCTTVRLDAARLADLRQRYTGCLCLRCLAELAAADAAATADRPT